MYGCQHGINIHSTWIHRRLDANRVLSGLLGKPVPTCVWPLDSPGKLLNARKLYCAFKYFESCTAFYVWVVSGVFKPALFLLIKVDIIDVIHCLIISYTKLYRTVPEAVCSIKNENSLIKFYCFPYSIIVFSNNQYTFQHVQTNRTSMKHLLFSIIVFNNKGCKTVVT